MISPRTVFYGKSDARVKNSDFDRVARGRSPRILFEHKPDEGKKSASYSPCRRAQDDVLFVHHPKFPNLVWLRASFIMLRLFLRDKVGSVGGGDG